MMVDEIRSDVSSAHDLRKACTGFDDEGRSPVAVAGLLLATGAGQALICGYNQRLAVGGS